MKHRDRCHKLLSLAVKRHYETLMMTFIKLHKAPLTSRRRAMALQPKFTIQERELQLEEHLSQKTYWSMASSHLELYHCSSNNSNGGHFAEWSYCKHNGCTQSAAMARGVQEHKWGLVYYISISPSFSSLCRLCTHAQQAITLHFFFHSSWFGSLNILQWWWQKSPSCDSYSCPSAR